ncbi:MAG: hypothetical protein ACYS14_01725 [Planctomycetota bacterium]
MSVAGVKKYVSPSGVLVESRAEGPLVWADAKKKTERNAYAPCLDPVVAERDTVIEPAR